jgi:hypothetical protein
MRHRKDISVFCTLLLILCIAMLGLSLAACEDEEKPILHYKVYQEKADGSYTLWVMKEKPNYDGGFVYWDRDDGTRICVSGSITVESFKVGEE